MKTIKLACWIFVAGIALVGGLGIFFSAISVERGSGPGAPLEGVAVAIGLLASLVALGVFALCIWFRPRELREGGSRMVVSGILAISVAVGLAVSLRAAIYRTGLFEMRVVVVDASGQPLPGVTVSWEGLQLGGGMGNYNSPATGSARTDGDGAVSFIAHHPHRIDLHFQFPDESKTGVMIEHCGPTWGHVITPSQGASVRALSSFQMHFERIMVPNNGDVTLEVRKK